MTMPTANVEETSMASDADKRGDKGCTACAPGRGCPEPGEACGAEEVYGIYAGAIRDGVANCADYLDRIVRQMERVPSRHYVAEKAQALRAAAGGLVGVCHDVEVWLRYCGKPVPFGGSGFTDECVLVAGHGGDCAADVAPPPLEVARRGADGLAEVATELADALGWLVHDPGRLGEPSVLEDLGRRYWKLSRDVDRLSPLLSALRTAKDKPVADVLLDGGGEGDEVDELVCTACEFEAESIEALAEHLQEEGH
jgi:hypothetical protein